MIIIYTITFVAAIIHTMDQVELWRSYPENTVTPFSQKSVGIFRHRFSLAPRPALQGGIDETFAFDSHMLARAPGPYCMRREIPACQTRFIRTCRLSHDGTSCRRLCRGRKGI
jgi:hypothetical protein